MKKFRLNSKKIILFLVGFVLIVVLAEIWISYHFIKVNAYEISSEKVQTPVRLVVLSDLHDHTFGTGNEKLISKVEAQAPDLILLVGDFLNEDSKDSHVPTELVKGLCDIAPVYYALGNHEISYMEQRAEAGENLIAELAEAGATVLDGSYTASKATGYVDVEIRDVKLRIGGLYDYAFALDGNNSVEGLEGPVREYLEEFQDTDRYTIMMSHRPDSLIFGNASTYWKIDLVVSGHDHGGQVVVPFKGGLYGGDQGWFPKYIHGLYRKDNLELYVTSGLGSEHQKLPRWNNPPEVAVIDLQ